MIAVYGVDLLYMTDKHDIWFDELPVSHSTNRASTEWREQQGLPHQLVFLHDLELIKDAGAQ
jgi:hypothetical protein